MIYIVTNKLKQIELYCKANFLVSLNYLKNENKFKIYKKRNKNLK